MAENPNPQIVITGAILEIPGVLTSSLEAQDGGTLLHLGTALPGLQGIEHFVPKQQLAVLRFIGATGAHERVEYVHGNEAMLEDECFAAPGRTGGLVILDNGRAHTEYVYTAAEQEKLERMQRAGIGARKRIPRHHYLGGLSPQRTVSQATQLAFEVHGTLLDRQTQLLGHLQLVAASDNLRGILRTPEAARELALSMYNANA
ncbi:MAG TPA: hypothetical protein VF466_03045 [Candidatus Saccharimonadales bacterium]